MQDGILIDQEYGGTLSDSGADLGQMNPLNLIHGLAYGIQ